MESSEEPMTGRRGRSARPPLSVERIALCAIALADEEGLETLSMRRLADRLGVEAMSLYHHVPSKAALLQAMSDRLGAALPVPAAGQWRGSLLAAAHAWRDLARQHPGAFPLLATRATAGEALLDRTAILVAGLQAAGFTPAASARAMSSFICSLNGYLLAAGAPALFRDLPEPAIDDYRFDEGRALLGDIPLEAWVLTSDAAFEFHVTMLLDGLQAALERGAAATRC
jgi:AcrR family transcriptional regulator